MATTTATPPQNSRVRRHHRADSALNEALGYVAVSTMVVCAIAFVFLLERATHLVGPIVLLALGVVACGALATAIAKRWRG